LAELPFACEATLTNQRALDRLVFCEAIPALHALLLASSSSDRVLLLRIHRYVCGSYELEIESAMPLQSCGSTIKGLAVCRVPSAPQPTLEGTLLSTVEQMRAVPPQQQPHALMPCPSPAEAAAARGAAERWRAYVLFADEQLAAFELSDAPLPHALDVRSFFP